MSEAKAWRQELKQRAIEQGRITQEKLEGAKPDWHGEFLQWRNKRERIDFFTAMDDAGFGRVEAITELVKAVVRSKRETRSKSARRKKGHHGNDRLIRLRSVPENVGEPGKVILLTAGNEVVRPPETASVPESPKAIENAPCRNRTCNPVIKSHLLCQLS